MRRVFGVLLIFLMLCAPAGAADVFAPLVSVGYSGVSFSGGTVLSSPVSVTFVGWSAVEGSIVSDPVSVTNVNTYLVDSPLLSAPVSVSFENSIGLDGTIVAKPVSLALNSFLGLWSMDENWLDTSGNNNNGTAFGNPVFDLNGKVGAAGSFNGVTSYVDAGSSVSLRPYYAVSMEAWIKVNPAAASNLFIAGNTDEIAMSGYALEYNAGFIRMRTGNGAWNSVTGVAAITPGIWYHVAGTYDGKSIKIYINGALDNESPASGIITYKNPFRIGYRPGSAGAGYFNGLIDELAVFGRPLSASEVASHYKAGKLDITPPAVPTVDPVATPTASPLLTLSGTKEADTSIWINGTRMVELNASTSWQCSYTLTSGVNTLNITAVDAADNQSGPSTITVILDDKPPYMTGSVPADKSDTAKVINNVTIDLLDTYSQINLAASTAAATVKNAAGQTVGGSWTFSGAIRLIFTPTNPFDQDTYTVTIYPTDALGNSGTKQITFTTHDVTPPVSSISLSGTLGADGWYKTTVTATLTATDGVDGSGVGKTEYSFDNSSWNTYSSPITVDKDGSTTLYYRSMDVTGNTETPKTVIIKINKSGVIGLWHMDNNWLDSSVLGNNGTAFNGATFDTDAKTGSHSGSFDGADDRVTIPEATGIDLSRMPVWTIEAWIKPYGFDGQSWPTIYSEGRWGISLGLNKTTGKPESWINNTNQFVATIAVRLNEWNHVALVFDGTGRSFYVNGVFAGSGPAAAVAADNNGSSIGDVTHSPNSSRFFGLIDEVEIYNRGLTAEEITAHYDSGTIPSPTVDPVSSPTASRSITLSGTKAANTAILVNGTEIVSLDDLTTWQGTFTLQNGSNALSVVSADAQGDRSQSVMIVVAYDNVAPSITGATPANNASVNTPVSAVKFVLTDDFANVDLAATVNGASVRAANLQEIAGTWSTSGADTVIFTPSSPFADGTYTATIYPTDSLGNSSIAGIVFTYDTNAPPDPVINAVFSPTNLSSQVITGTKTEDSNTVIVTSTTATVGQVAYPTSTTWSVSITGLQQGANTITAAAKDAAGNQSMGSSVSIIYDITPPAALAVDPFASPTKESSITLSGTKESGSYLYVNNAKTGAPAGAATWSYTVSLSKEGKNTITLFAKDEAGNQGQSVSVDVYRDTTAPKLASSSPSGGAFTNQAGNVVITFADDYSAVDLAASLAGATVKNSSGALIGGGWSSADGRLVFVPATPFTDGTYTVTLYPVDALGNKGTVSFSFTVDATPPVVQSLTMSPTSPHRAEVVTFTVTFNEAMSTDIQPLVTFGRTAPFADYTLSGSWIDAKTWRASFQFTTSTGDGSYTIEVSTAKDKAQNMMSPREAGNFILSTAPSLPPTVNPVTTPTKTPNQTLSGAKPANTGIAINGVQKVGLDVSTAWSYTYPLSEGKNDLNITARDAAGNDSTPVVVTIVLDTIPPLFTIDTYKSPSPAATQTISGKKEPGCNVKMNNAVIYDSSDLNPVWSRTVNLTAGITNRFAFAATDAIGNTTSKTIDITYDVSAPAPLGPGVLMADGKGKGTEITLSWAAYIESADIAYYSVYMSSAGFSDITGMTPIATTNKGAKTFKSTGLTQGSTYYFAVVPLDISGNFDPSVNIVPGVPTDTVAPEDVKITSVTAGYDATNGNFITLQWTPSVNSSGDLADQIVYFDSGTGYDAGTPLGKAVSTYTKAALNDGTRYKFKITVKDTSGHESTGALAEGVTRLNNPTGLTALPGNAKAALAWAPVISPYVKQYNIYRVASDTQVTDVRSMVRAGTTTAAVTAFTDANLTNGTMYQYAVTAVNLYGAERTDVLSVAAKPRLDDVGPKITAFSVTQGQVITGPITITASATDAESSMGKLELYVDGLLVKSQAGGSISHYWNTIDIADGNHTVKLIAYDQFGNATEEQRQVIVSVGPPAVPSITGHTVVQTTPEYLVNVTGTAPLNTTVSLKVNNSIAAQTPTTAAGAFSFSAVKLMEGDNLLSAKAAHRGGESAYSPDYKITVDTGAPPSPVNLSAQVITGGPVRLTWQNGSGEMPFGYNLYMSATTFNDRTAPGVIKTNAALIKYTLTEYTPTDDSQRFYAVTSLDSSGNESGISNVVAVSSDRAAPAVTSLEYRYTDGAGLETYPATTAGPGSVKVALAVSEALKELPFLSLEPAVGSPIIVTMKKIDDSHYEGDFAVSAQSPHGPTVYKFSGKDMNGNRGNAQGSGISIDVKGPEASIQSPTSLLQTSAGPVQVDIVFNEPSATPPVMQMKASNGATVPITALSTPDEGIHWTGTVDPSGLPDGRAEFILIEAKDRFVNIGTTVSSGRFILLYKDTVPPPGVPTGLAAKSSKGGVITLTWTPVEGATSYAVYRRAENETTPSRVMTNVLGSPAQDTPPADGSYFYSVSSTGLLQSESQLSAEVQATSDRTGPEAPFNLALSLGGSGVTASWQHTGDQLTAFNYNLYRSDATIASVDGLTPLLKTKTTQAVDTSPTQAKRFYAVSALDSLGNEGPLSETKEIVFPVSPVRNLVLERLDAAAPVLTWQAPAGGSIIGYHIYRNGSLITQTPVIDITYTDGYYSGGTVTYGISAVDSLGNESPIQEVALYDISVGLQPGTSFRRGLLEAAQILLTSEQGVTIDALDVKVGIAPSSTIDGPFALTANSAYQVEKVVATTADAPSPVSVLITAKWSPVPGAMVKITKTSAVDVTASGSAFEIFNDPLIRGTDAKVRLKVNNIGTAQMEFLTSQNSGVTKKVAVNLKDEDGNVLSTGYLDQRVGNAIVNTGPYAVARLNPNENILTEPVILSVPMSSPYKVIIEASIENTYYHYNKADQVTAPGMTQSAATVIAETAYRAEATPEHTFYPNAQPVLITGRAISNTPSATGEEVPMPFVPVKIGISVRSFDRYYTVTSDANGQFSFTFTPGANEAGVYSVWAIHPDVKDRTVQSNFAIAGLAISPDTATVRMARGKSLDIPIAITNYGGAPLNGLAFDIQSSTGITAEVINTGDDLLTTGEKANMILRISSSTDAPETGFATVVATTAEGLSVRLDAAITMVSLIPVINTTPSYIDAGMVKGNQKIASFTIKNVGEDTLRGARIEGPSTAWMTLAVEKNIGDLPPGTSKSVGVMFSPPETLPQGVYDDKLVIYSDNHIPYTYHIQVTVTSDAVGNVLFDVLNELMEDVAGASITLQNQLLPELLYTLKTGADGTVIQYDIPEGRYSFNISAPGHKSYSGSFVATAGLTTTVPVALEVTLVTVEWSVTPVTIEDRYEINITTTFATNVPTPVLVIEPAGLTVPELQPGEVFNGEFMISNYGLIALNEVNIQFPSSFGEYDIELMGTLPKTLNAMQKITMPYKITRRIATAFIFDPSNSAYSLFDEVKGYGGSSPCYNSFNVTVEGWAVICPGSINENKVKKKATYTVMVPIPGTNCSISGGGTGGGFYIGGGGSTGAGGGGRVQSGGGWLPGGEPTLIDTEEDYCEGTDLPRCNNGHCADVCTNSVVKLNSGTYEDAYVDLDVKTNGMPIAFERYYVSRWVPVGKVLHEITESYNVATGSGGGGAGIGKKHTLSVYGFVDSRKDPPPQAYGWTSPWFAMVKEVVGGLAYYNGYGQVIYFVRSDATSTAPLSAADTFKPSPGGERFVEEAGLKIFVTTDGIQVKDKSGLTRYFGAVGKYKYKLTAIKDARGKSVFVNSAGVGPSSITDASGNAILTFDYNAHGYISQISDRDGRTVRYNVDDAGRLRSVNGLEGKDYSYEYGTINHYALWGEPPASAPQGDYHLLTTKIDPEGHVTTITYKVSSLGGTHDVDKVTEPGGTRSFTYDFPGYVFYYKNTVGTEFKYTVNGSGKLTSISRYDSATKEQNSVVNISYSGRDEHVAYAGGTSYTVRRNEQYDPISIIDGRGNETKIEYNQYWKVTKITDPLGKSTHFIYNGQKDLVFIGYPDGGTVYIERDGFGNATKVTRGTASETSTTLYEYDDRGNVVKMTGPEGGVTTYGYDQYGHLNRISDPEGHTTVITNDKVGRPLTVQDPVGGTTTYTYDRKGNLSSVTDPKGNITAYTYDYKGRTTSVTDAKGNKTAYFYDGEGSLTAITEAAETTQMKTTNLSYDVLSRLQAVSDPEGNMTTYSYAGSSGCPVCSEGNASLPTKITDPLGRVTLLTFDGDGRVIGVKDPMNYVSGIGYDPNGKLATVTDANGKITRYLNDALGRVVKQTAADAGETTFTYDSRGNVKSLSDPNGNVTSFDYDASDRMIRETRPMGQAIEYTYYANGLTKTVKDAKGQVTTYAYDQANRLMEISYADGKKDSFTYDSAGNMITYSKDGVSGTITYDELNRKLSETVNYGAFSKTYSYTYDPFGNKATYTSPEGKTYAYDYNRNDKPTSVTFNGKTIGFDYQWDMLRDKTFPNGITTDYSYNANSWLRYINTKNAASSYLNKAYEFDKVGNITRRTDNATSITDFSYDETYQLTGATSLSLTESFTYNKTGNRLTSQKDTQPVVNYSHNANNELLELLTPDSSLLRYQYDANGNSIQKDSQGQITRYTYNSANRLERVELPDGRTAIYAYDPFGRRIKKDVNGQVTHYLYTDEGLIGEYDAAGNLQKEYGWMADSIWGTNPVFMQQGENYYFYHNDHLGAPQKMTDESGTIVWSAKYMAFGKATIDVALVTNNLRFPGQYYDEETGLHYNWNRYYDLEAGRYTQVDPIGFAGGDGNLYRSVFNRPLTLVDNYGLEGCKPVFDFRYLEGLFIGGNVKVLGVGLNIEANFGRSEKSSAQGDLVSQSFAFAVDIPLVKQDLGWKIERSTPGKPIPRRFDPLTGAPVLGSGWGIQDMLKGKPWTDGSQIKEGVASAQDKDGDIVVDFEAGALLGGAGSINLSELWRQVKKGFKPETGMCPRTNKLPQRVYDCHRY